MGKLSNLEFFKLVGCFNHAVSLSAHPVQPIAARFRGQPSPNLAGEGAQFLREQRWLFERGKMATAIEFVPVNEIRVDLPSPTAGSGKVSGKHACSHRQIDAAGIVPLAEQCALLKIKTCRGGCRSRQPVKRYLVKNRVVIESSLGGIPVDIVKPGSETRRRV
jgi:hypothetical protein